MKTERFLKIIVKFLGTITLVYNFFFALLHGGALFHYFENPSNAQSFDLFPEGIQVMILSFLLQLLGIACGIYLLKFKNLKFIIIITSFTVAYYLYMNIGYFVRSGNFSVIGDFPLLWNTLLLVICTQNRIRELFRTIAT